MQSSATAVRCLQVLQFASNVLDQTFIGPQILHALTPGNAITKLENDRTSSSTFSANRSIARQRGDFFWLEAEGAQRTAVGLSDLTILAG
jgi:hypothetical protein